MKRIIEIIAGIGFIGFGYFCLSTDSFGLGCLGMISSIVGVCLIIGFLEIDLD